jgi:predicted amino acid-binding ACT domain protein
MYPETKRYIEQIAKEYNCLRGEKPSIGELLAQIHSGRLIVSKASINLPNQPDRSTIGFRIEVPRYLKGTVAVISKKIAARQGNITAVNTKAQDNLGILQFFLSLPPESSLSDLISDLQSIKIKQLAQFNEESELEFIASDFELIGEQKKVDRFERFLEKKLVYDLVCVIGFQLIAKDSVGVLAKIAEQIAQARLLIYSVSETVGDDIGEAKINLFLYLRSKTENNILDRIKKIDDVIKQLKKIEEVKKVETLGVDSLD